MIVPFCKARAILQFKFTPKYPDEPPEMKIVESENIRDEEVLYEFIQVLVI